MTHFRILLLLCIGFFFVPSIQGQNTLQRPKNPDYPGRYGSSPFLSRLSATATVGSGWVNGNFDRFAEVGLGEITVSYALFRWLDVGLSTSGSLLCNEKIDDNLGGTIPGYIYNPDIDDCDKSWAFGQSFSVMGRYFPLSELPAFAQLNAGYSLDGEAPFVGFCLGWGQPVYDRISVIGQLRYATLIGSDLDFDLSPGGLRLELGVGWNL